MLLSIALIMISGMVLGAICKHFRLPSLIGMIIAGMFLSPFAFNLLDDKLLLVAADLRQIALVIILTKAGLSLDLSDLKRVGRPAILMCFIPACFEILAIVLIAPPLLHINVVEAFLMGSVLAAVSPAVIVPRMVKIMEEGYGKKNSIPQLILAGASLDDIFVIVLFSTFLSLVQTKQLSYINFIQIPISIILGVIVGVFIGLCLIQLFKRIHISNSFKVLLILSISFLLIEIQNRLNGVITISALLAIMMIGITIKRNNNVVATCLSNIYNKLWIPAEIMLFVLVGITINMKFVLQAGFLAIIVIIVALFIRILGVNICLVKSKLNKNERIFCMGAYIPKATVQAAIGSIPLSLGLSCGEMISTLAVLSILISAPLGSFFIDHMYHKLLIKD